MVLRRTLVLTSRQDQLALKIVLPERLSCIAVDPRGIYCAGGTAQGRVYLWEASRPTSFPERNTLDIRPPPAVDSVRDHVRSMGRTLPTGTVLRFTQDGGALLSGSEDSGVNVWAVSKCVCILLRMKHYLFVLV